MVGRVNKILFFFLIFTLSCTPTFQMADELYSDHIPNPQLVKGIFINSLCPEQDTLVIGGNMFFLLTKDSIGKNVIIRGKWYYASVADHIRTYGLELYPMSEQSTWSGGIHCQNSDKNTKLLVLDTLWGYHRFLPTEHVWDFKNDRRLDSLSRLPREMVLNSIGRPYRFVRKLIEIEGRYY